MLTDERACIRRMEHYYNHRPKGVDATRREPQYDGTNAPIGTGGILCSSCRAEQSRAYLVGRQGRLAQAEENIAEEMKPLDARQAVGLNILH